MDRHMRFEWAALVALSLMLVTVFVLSVWMYDDLAGEAEDGALAVGLWNLFPDPVDSPVIHLDRVYASVDLYHATGALAGDRVHIDGELPPYGFAFFTVR